MHSSYLVIPTYNPSRQVQSAIRSVLDQTHSYLEAIVVDDRSIDNTVQVVEEYSRKDPRIRLIVQRKEGEFKPHAIRELRLGAANG